MVFVLTEGSSYSALGTLVLSLEELVVRRQEDEWTHLTFLLKELNQKETWTHILSQAIHLSEHLAYKPTHPSGSAKAGSVSGNGKGMPCFSKDFSTAVTHGGQKEPTCTRH